MIIIIIKKNQLNQREVNSLLERFGKAVETVLNDLSGNSLKLSLKEKRSTYCKISLKGQRMIKYALTRKLEKKKYQSKMKSLYNNLVIQELIIQFCKLAFVLLALLL